MTDTLMRLTIGTSIEAGPRQFGNCRCRTSCLCVCQHSGMRCQFLCCDIDCKSLRSVHAHLLDSRQASACCFWQNQASMSDLECSSPAHGSAACNDLAVSKRQRQAVSRCWHATFPEEAAYHVLARLTANLGCKPDISTSAVKCCNIHKASRHG